MSKRRTRPTLVAAVVVGSVVALLVVLLATRNLAGDRPSSVDLVGKPAPAVGGNVLIGDPFDLGASDRWVVVNFFATWCVPCIKEHPELRSFSVAHDEIGDARVISIVYDQKPQVVKDWFLENGGDWTVFDSDEGRTAFEWGVTGIPESYLVAPDGTVVEHIVGGVTQAYLDQLIVAYSGGGGEGS